MGGELGKNNLPDMPKANYGDALNYFKRAAELQNQNYQTGLNEYQSALDTASKQLMQGYSNSNLLLAPVSDVANQANNEILRLTGQTPLSESLGIANQISRVGDGTFKTFAEKLLAAEKVKESWDRSSTRTNLAKEYENVLKQKNPWEDKAKGKFNLGDANFTKALAGTSDPKQIYGWYLGNPIIPHTVEGGDPKEYRALFASHLSEAERSRGISQYPSHTGRNPYYMNTALGRSLINQAIQGANYSALYNVQGTAQAQGLGDPERGIYLAPQKSGYFESKAPGQAWGAKFGIDYGAKLHKLATQAKEGWKTQQAQYEKNMREYDNNKNKLTSLFNSWKTSYTDEAPRPYTQEEIQEKISSTPGYKFAQEQQSEAIARQQAARGMYRSSNTLMGIQDSSQQLFQNTLQGYLNNLQNIVQQGSGATTTIAANQVNEGTNLGNLTTAGGEAAMNTYGAMGQNWAQSYYRSGDTIYDANKFNTTMKFQDYMRQMGQQGAMQAAGLNSAAGLGYLGLANRQFGAQQQQGRNIGQGFASGWGSI